MSNQIKLGSIFLYTAILFAIATIASYIGKDADVGLGFLIVYFIIVILGIIIANVLRNVIVSLIVSIIIPSMLGYALGPLMNYYVESLGSGLVVVVFLGATGIFLIAGIIGFFTKRDLSGMGWILFFSLLAVIILSVIGALLGAGELFHVIIAGVSLLIFTGYTIYDLNRIKQEIDTMEWYQIPLYGLDLFINLFNMFLDLLRIVNYLKGDD